MKKKILSTKTNAIQFWSYLKELKDFNNQDLFSNISQLALIILTLPHGNADVKRTSSCMVDFKTKKGNKLLPSTLSALLTIKLDLLSKKQCCVAYQFNEKHIQKYKSKGHDGLRPDDVASDSDSDISD